mgnify:CR=1 FL=1
MTSSNDINYINAPNYLKQKVGSGGIPPKLIEDAQKVIENNEVDFTPYTQNFLDFISATIDKALKSKFRTHDHVTEMIYPVMQLKAHGGMFRQPLISEIAASALSFLENIYVLDDDALDVIKAHYNALKPILENRIRGLGGKEGQILVKELHNVCQRYYTKYDISPDEY